MKFKTLVAVGIGAICAAGVVNAHEHKHDHKHDHMIPAGASIKVKVQQLDPVNGNKDVGTVTITESKYGLVFTPNLSGLEAGLHGFHIHQNPSCEPKEKDGKLTAGLAPAATGIQKKPKNTVSHGKMMPT